MKKNIVSVIMGSDSDWPVMQSAVEVLKEFNISYEVKIVSAHRTPRFMQKYALGLQKRGLKIVIAGAGGSAHLPGMVSALTPLPVIGVPVKTKKLKGLDSLLSIVQMPKGVPVAVVAVDNAYNAGLLAVRMLALSQKTLTKKIVDHLKKQGSRTKKSEKLLLKSLKKL